MLFNNPAFFLFFAVVYLLYWALNRRAQHVLLLTASYFFYGWWNWRMLALLFACSAVAYACGLGLERTRAPAGRRALLVIGLLVNLGLLAYFKYCNFFLDELAGLFARLGVPFARPTWNILLPVGVSFFTFQAASYVIDIYRRALPATRDLTEFLVYIAFFPQLVAGPIERASHMLPQFARERRFDAAAAADGAWRVLWGLLKKVVVADTLSGLVDAAYTDPAAAGGARLLLASYFFAIQIYCDFSGYSDMAVGLGQMLGFDLTVNFRHPYFARSPSEFWSRWHVTLTSWFRDYLYIPLGGNRCARARWRLNVLVVFAVSGLWHGANWTFVIWGALNGLFFLAFGWMEQARADRRAPPGGPGLLARPAALWRMVLTFHLILLTWVFFRAPNLSQAWFILGRMAHLAPGELANALAQTAGAVLLVVLFLVVEWLQRARRHGLDFAVRAPAARFALCTAVVLVLVWWGRFEHVPFIYFQF